MLQNGVSTLVFADSQGIIPMPVAKAGRFYYVLGSAERRCKKGVEEEEHCGCAVAESEVQRDWCGEVRSRSCRLS